MSAFCWFQTSGVAFDNKIHAIFFVSPLAEIGKFLSNSHRFKLSLHLNGYFISRRLSPWQEQHTMPSGLAAI